MNVRAAFAWAFLAAVSATISCRNLADNEAASRQEELGWRLQAYIQPLVDNRDFWLHLNDYHIGRYMLPLEDGGFQLRDFTGRVYFNRSSSGAVESLTWKLPKVWNAKDEEYVRSR